MADKALIQEMKERIMDGLTVLIKEDILYGAGHLSARIPGTNTFLINPRYPGNVAMVDDISVVDIATGKRIDGPGPIPSETHIHTEIYKARPDLESVTHCHPRYASIVGLLDRPWVPFNLDASNFSDGIGVYPESHLVDDIERGRKLAQSLGPKALAVFQKGHGIAVGGPSIESTVVLTTHLESACRDLLSLLPIREPVAINDELAGDPARRLNRLKNDYRSYPFLLQKHGIRSREEIRAKNKPAPEGRKN
ncbi:MAG: class II aldolase/adducin family protein [Dehalococcoidia bacterium]|nr:class II aldolase/adducin family protein [Dehalococcoidia bacterium]